MPRLPLLGPFTAPLVYALLLAAVGIVLCQVPLFNLLGYESSLALAACAALVAGHLGVRAVHRHRESDRLRATAALSGAAWVRSVSLRALGTAVLVLVPPLLLLLANGLRVRNCDYLAGLGFFAMMPVAGALCAAALGVACALWLRRGALPVTLGILVLVSLAWTGWRVLSSPAVFAYDPFFGFFPGSLYDEEVAVTAPFYWARAYHGAGALAALALSAAALDARDRQARLRGLVALAGLGVPSPRRRALGLGGLALLAALLLYYERGPLGFDRDGAAVRAVLSRERRTEHFILRYAPGGAVDRDIDLIAREHELRYAQLRELLRVSPDWTTPRWQAWLLRLDDREARSTAVDDGHSPAGARLTSFLFESARQKAELMGAAHTYIAKPWRREIYLQHEAWPHPVLKHELAHVFAGAAGDPLLHMSLRGPLPELGLIEGLAVAADWPGGRLTVHQQVKALRDAGLAPPLPALFGPAFWSQPSTRAYAVAGSFCRYLLERHGPAPLLAVYRAGGRDAAFRAAYGQSLPALSGAFWTFIDGQPVPPAERAVEQERARRPAVFYKVCAHELALRRQRAREAAGRGDSDEARRLMRSVCSDDPVEPRHLLDLSDVLWGMGLRAEAAAVSLELLRHRAASGVLRGRALERIGDEAFLRAALPAARSAWQAAAKLPSDEGASRMLAVKLLTSDPQVLDAEPQMARAAGRVLRVLVGDPTPGHDTALDLLALHEATDAAPDSPLPHYLLGRQLLNRGAFAAAAEALGRALALPYTKAGLALPDERFVLQARLWRGQALLRAGDSTAAATLFAALCAEQPAGAEGRRVELCDWADRARRWGQTAPSIDREAPSAAVIVQ